MKKYLANGNYKKAGVTTLISDKIDFETMSLEIKSDIL